MFVTRRMKTLVGIIALGVAVSTAPVAFAEQSICAPLRNFVKSVKPGEIREFTFHTRWGGGFSGAPEGLLYEKRCERDDYAPAQKVCNYLMEFGAIEFADDDVKDAFACLRGYEAWRHGIQGFRGRLLSLPAR